MSNELDEELKDIESRLAVGEISLAEYNAAIDGLERERRADAKCPMCAGQDGGAMCCQYEGTRIGYEKQQWAGQQMRRCGLI
jgi:hypothetical protein